jgi:L-threonylcarbamoyladenylate synthase
MTATAGSITQAVTHLRHGGVVALPTDTVYGIAASLQFPDAISRLYEIKGRTFEKAIAVLLADIDQLPQVAHPLPPAAQRLAAQHWPGALTLVILKQMHLPAILSPYPTIGVRVPAHPVTRAVLAQTGPLAVTSANRSGQPDSFTAAEVRAHLGDALDFVLDDGRTPGTAPSTVVDCSGATIRVLRTGALVLQPDQLLH